MATLLKEKKRHLLTKQYAYTIHPFSRFVKYRQMFMFVVLFLSLWLDPYLGSFYARVYFDPTRERIPIDGVVVILTFCLTIDLVVCFFMGYNVDKTREVVLQQKMIAKRYLRTFFFFDFIPLLQTYLMIFFGRHISIEARIFIYTFKSFRVVRLFTMLQNFMTVLKRLRIKELQRKICALVVLACLFLHFCACHICLSAELREISGYVKSDSWLNRLEEFRAAKVQALDPTAEDPVMLKYLVFIKYYGTMSDYLEHFQVVVSHFMGAGIGQYKTRDEREMMIFSMLLILGLFYWVVMLAYVLQIYGTTKVSESSFEELLMHMTNYMVRNRFPHRLKRRILKYYDIKFNKMFFSEIAILNTLSVHLRMEVLLYSCRHMVSSVHIFRGLSRAAVGSMLALLRHEIYLPGDIIMSNDDPLETKKLFFVAYGTCAMLTTGGVEATHIEDGNQFGEIAQDETDPITVLYTVQAIEVADIYYLRETDFQYCCARHPEILHKMSGVLKQKMEQYTMMVSVTEAGTGGFYGADIITELRLKRILHRGIRRELMM